MVWLLPSVPMLGALPARLRVLPAQRVGRQGAEGQVVAVTGVLIVTVAVHRPSPSKTASLRAPLFQTVGAPPGAGGAGVPEGGGRVPDGNATEAGQSRH